MARPSSFSLMDERANVLTRCRARLGSGSLGSANTRTVLARRQDIAILSGAPASKMLSLIPFASLADSYYVSYVFRHSDGAPELFQSVQEC
ncbi:hypothetical protein VYU27_001732 [Nannochloropsis oceanica]